MGFPPIIFCFDVCQSTFVIVFAVKFDPLVEITSSAVGPETGHNFNFLKWRLLLGSTRNYG